MRDVAAVEVHGAEVHAQFGLAFAEGPKLQAELVGEGYVNRERQLLRHRLTRRARR